MTNNTSGDSSKPNFNVTILVAMFTLVASVTASYLTMRGDIRNTDSSNIQAFIAKQIDVNSGLMREITLLKQEVAKAIENEERWRMRYIEVSLEKLEVERQLNDKTDEASILEAWMDDMPFAAWAKKRGMDGYFILVAINERFTSNYGLTKADAIGKTDLQLFPEALAYQYIEADEQVIATGQPLRGVVNYQNTDGEIVQMNHIKYVMHFSDGEKGVAGMVID